MDNEIPQITARVDNKYFDDILGGWIYRVKINEADIGEWCKDFAEQIVNKINGKTYAQAIEDFEDILDNYCEKCPVDYDTKNCNCNIQQIRERINNLSNK